MKKEKVFLVFLFFTIFIFNFSLSFSQTWLSGWQYRIPITIRENSGNTLTDYQVLVTINTQNLISQGKMRNNCGDIRFTDSDGRSSLNYWIESGCNSANTKIWVKVPNIPANSNKIIYMYYGNSSANSMSNGEGTFIFFDDFRTNPNTNGKWRIFRYSNDVNNEFVWDNTNNQVYLTRNLNGKGVMAFFNKSFSPYNTITEFEIYIGGGNGADGLSFYFDKNINPYITYGRALAGGSMASMAFDGSNSYLSEGYSIGFDTWRNTENGYEQSTPHIEVARTSATNPSVHYSGAHLTSVSYSNLRGNWLKVVVIIKSNAVEVYINNVLQLSYTGLTSLNYNWQGIGASTGGYNDNHAIKNLRVRKFAPQEPTYTLGREESITLVPVWLSYFSNVSQAIINQPIKFSSLWNASQIPYLTQPSQTWLSGWQYRIPITIRENSGNTLTDYQILVTNPIYNESGLISSWHFNEGSGTIAFDSSGNNNNGNLVNDPTWADGKFGRALNFDGTNDYVISSTGISPPSTFTVNVWIYYTGDNGVVVDWLGQANINTGYHASGIEIVGGTVRVRYWNLPCVNLGSITPNNWYMITLVYDGNNLKGYINGEFKGSTSGALSHPSTLYIALAAADSTNCGDGSYFAGKIDEFRFYNRALSDVEIQALYQAKARLDYGDIRFTDSDGVSLLNYWQEADGKFWVKVPNIPANSNKIIYLYYGNPNANSMSNGDLVFTESGTLFITRYSTADPQNLSEALVAWNAAPQTTGYCTRYLSSFVNINNRGTNGCGGAYSNIAFYIEAFFYVDVAGTWSFRHGPDYGRGGGLYLDNSPLEEAWTSNLWWNGNWGSDSVLDGSKTLSVGWHRLVSFGFEDCCDGGQTIQFLRPGSAWADWSTTNLNIKSRKYVSPEPTISVGNEEIRNYEQIYLYLSNYIFSYKLGNSQWINETYRFPSWQYRISITINNTQNSNTLIDYQILVTINTQNLISQGKMRNDCGDIRFTDSDEITLLNYWIEDGCNTTNTKIWVKVPDIPANSNKIIYLYYGNPEATSMSNGDLVFEFFDDFLGTSLNTNKWIAYSNDYTISNGILRINKGGIERTTAFPFNIQDGYIVETKVRHHEYLLYGKSGVLPSIGSSPYTAKNNDNADATIIYVRGCVLFIFCNTYYYIGDGSTNSFNVADGEGIDEVTENNAWYITGISVNGGVIRFWYNGEVKTTITGVNWAKNLKYVKLGSYLRNANYEIQDTSYDWIRIRKYTPLEPTISLGNEEITSMLPFTAWANVTKSFSQPGTLCWKFYANNTLNLWNVTQDSCLNIFSPDFWLEAKLLDPRENSIINLIPGEGIQVKANVTLRSNYFFCTNGNATLRYNTSTSMLPNTAIPTSSAPITTDSNPIYIGNLCVNNSTQVVFNLIANSQTYKIVDVNFCFGQICNNTLRFFVNVSITTPRNLTLKKGWNLISIPYKTINLDLNRDGCNLRERVFHYFNASSNSWEYHTYKNLRGGIAYWIYSEKNCESVLYVSDAVTPSDMPGIIQGRKNYIGSLSSSRSLREVYSNLPEGCNLMRWDPEQNRFLSLSISSNLTPWYGYILECS